MKTKFFLLAVLPLFMFVSCEKHECNALSWTDYNSVEDVICNALYKEEALKTRDGETLKLYGWLFYNKYSDSSNTDQYLTSNKDIIGEVNGSVVSRQLVHLFVTENSLIPKNPYDSILYVSGVVYWDDVEPTGIHSILIRVENEITKSPEL